jgi:O-antigen/teichoic acid export membrane protein
MTTQTDNRRIAKNTLLLYFRMFITMGVGFYTSRVILNALGVTDFGIYNVVGGIVGSLSVLNGAMAGATQRWITIALGEGNIDKLKKVFSVGLTAQLIIGLIILLVIETIGLWYLYNYAVIPKERMASAFIVFQISTLTMFLTILNVPFNGAIIAHEKMSAFAFFSIFDVIMKLVICFALYYTSSDKLILYSILLFVTYFINFSAIQIYSHKRFIEAKLKFGWDKKMYKEMWGLAFWTISGNVAYVGYTQGITLLINLFFGPAMNAAAGVANQATNIINQFSGNFQIALNPQITKNYAQGNYTDMHKLMFRSAKFSYFLMLLFAIPLFYEAPYLLKLWLGNVPEHSVGFMRIGLFVSMIMAVRNPLITAAMANGKLRNYQFIVNGIILMVCPILYVVYKFGAIPESAFIVLLFIMTLATLASAYMLRNMVFLNFKDFIKNVMTPIILYTPLSFIPPLFIYISMQESFYRLLILTFVSVISTIIVIYHLVLNKNEKLYLSSFIKTKLKIK